MTKLLFTALVLMFAYTNFYAQTDWVKWVPEIISYKIDNPVARYGETENPASESGIIPLIRNTYAFFISDLDGDNCPFYPSCSNFFVQSVNKAGLIKGSLMFSDRFMRDLNLFKSRNRYTVHKSGKFFDPPQNYTLIQQEIKYSESGVISK